MNDQFKVWVLVSGESTWATNGLEFDSAIDAKKWGEGLFMRWFALKDFAVLPVKDEFKGYLTQDIIDAFKV